MYFMEHSGVFGEQIYKFDANRLHQAHKWCQDQTHFYLDSDYTVIVSNTFTTIKELRPYFDIALEFGLLPVVYLAQNQFDNVHSVPQESLDKMKNRFVYDISPLIKEYQFKISNKL